MNNFEKSCMELATKLISANVKFTYKKLYEGGKFQFTNGADAICHKWSYGGEQGFFETFGFEEDNGDVTGWLTADEVVSRLKKI